MGGAIDYVSDIISDVTVTDVIKTAAVVAPAAIGGYAAIKSLGEADDDVPSVTSLPSITPPDIMAKEAQKSAVDRRRRLAIMAREHPEATSPVGIDVSAIQTLGGVGYGRF